ncbi:MAG: DUF488 domain-containing protein [Candidatus Omnitrophota bacterium]|jgi:uncharacterized protein (DUF488 family)|nr:MAG: DUF488 domain-containing protein [Candidatus Omnitrophota bacterium]
MLTHLFTIGVYGYEEEAFFQQLMDARIDAFCDIRRRRGMRGTKYAFANAKRLEQRLTDLGIRYFHCKELAPSNEVRKIQKEHDRLTKTAKRERTIMNEAFKQAYHESVLLSFDTMDFIETIGNAENLALFCVERDYRACHRSILAERLRQDLNIPVQHLSP